MAWSLPIHGFREPVAGCLLQPERNQGAFSEGDSRTCCLRPQGWRMLEMIKACWADESGQGLAEYAVLITVVAVALFLAIVAFRDEIIRIFNRIIGILNTGS